eukprot:GHVT01049248.1.p1 GENE.GHVT01049248.1~~GHVT01049248.1.p1  ORF type:complete len:1465 (+),score=194.49 GHVT01049248.1:428-4822(+)
MASCVALSSGAGSTLRVSPNGKGFFSNVKVVLFRRGFAVQRAAAVIAAAMVTADASSLYLTASPHRRLDHNATNGVHHRYDTTLATRLHALSKGSSCPRLAFIMAAYRARLPYSYSHQFRGIHKGQAGAGVTYPEINCWAMPWPLRSCALAAQRRHTLNFGGQNRAVHHQARADFRAPSPPSPKPFEPVNHPAFDFVTKRYIDEFSVNAAQYRHKLTGLEVLSFSPEEQDGAIPSDASESLSASISASSTHTPPPSPFTDKEMVFAISFRTPVNDSCGTPHVLEHSVLCGSRKYPTKEPFSSMIRGNSLFTFLNAMTYSDKTIYPVASVNMKDFYNLVDVYLDAVFFPKAMVDPDILKQEGWHYTLKSGQSGHSDPPNNSDFVATTADTISAESSSSSTPSTPTASPSVSPSSSRIGYGGVVLNEMRGVYSAAETLLEDVKTWSLLPSTPYAHASGGDPAEIPKLTFEKFVEFYRKFYHPANARAFFWGRDDPLRRLEVLDEYMRDLMAARKTEETSAGVDAPLNGLSSSDIRLNSQLPQQPMFERPLFVEHPYPPQAGKLEDYVTVNWVINPAPPAHSPDTLTSCSSSPSTSASPSPPAKLSKTSTPPGSADLPSGFPSSFVLEDNVVLTPRDESFSPPDPSFFSALNNYDRLCLSVLSNLLLDIPAGPLYSKLMSSGLGQEFTGGSIDFDEVHSIFSVGLKGVPSRPGIDREVEALVFETLRDVSVNGFPDDAVASFLNRLEFGLKELSGGAQPKGLKLGITSLSAWNVDRCPIEALTFREPLQRLKKDIQDKIPIFQELLKTRLLRNPHRVTVRLRADPTCSFPHEKREAQRLAAAEAAMSEEDLEQVGVTAEKLKKKQEAPDSPEAIACLPKICRDDMETEIQYVPTYVIEGGEPANMEQQSSASVSAYNLSKFPASSQASSSSSFSEFAGSLDCSAGSEASGYTSSELSDLQSLTAVLSVSDPGIYLLHRPLPTSGLLYLRLAFSMRGISAADLPLLPLLCKMLTRSGTFSIFPNAFKNQIIMHTGGVDPSFSIHLSPKRGKVDASGADRLLVSHPGSRAFGYFNIVAKCLEEKAPEMLRIVGDMLTDSNLSLRSRALAILKEERSVLMSTAFHGGTYMAHVRASSSQTLPDLVHERVYGLSAIRTVDATILQATNDWPRLEARLRSMMLTILQSTLKPDSATGGADGEAPVWPPRVVVDVTGMPSTLQHARLRPGSVSSPSSSSAAPSSSSSDKPPLHPLTASLRGLMTRLRTYASSVATTPIQGPEERWAKELTEEHLVMQPSVNAKHVALLHPTPVNYMVFTGRLYDVGEYVSGSDFVISNMISMTFLWEKVRLVGGAYSVNFNVETAKGLFSFTSSRDPNIVSTIAAFRDVAAALQKAIASGIYDNQEEVTRVIAVTMRRAESLRSNEQLAAKGFQDFIEKSTLTEERLFRQEVGTHGANFCGRTPLSNDQTPSA